MDILGWKGQSLRTVELVWRNAFMQYPSMTKKNSDDMLEGGGIRGFLWLTLT